jgi:hypothetical protein
MRHVLWTGSALTFAWAVAFLPSYAQQPEQPRTNTPQTTQPQKAEPQRANPQTSSQTNPQRTDKQAANDLSVRGKIVKMNGPDQFTVQTSDNRRVTFFTNPQTRYTIDGRAGRFNDLRVGTEISGSYVTRDDRMFLNSVTVGAVSDAPPAPGGAVLDTNTLRGRIIKLQPPDQVVIRTSAGKELVLFTSTQTRFMVNGKAVQFTDLRVGAEINADFTVRDGRHIVTQITVGGAPNLPRRPEAVPAPEPPAPAPATPAARELKGSVVRVVGDNQIVIRTGDNKEVTVFVEPQTKYLVNEQPARFTDFQPGADIQVQYIERDRRPIARSIFGLRRR